MYKFKELNERVIKWATEKEIFKKATPLDQIEKTLEEVNETKTALFAEYQGLDEYFIGNREYNTKHEINDGFGDILVTVLIGCKMQGLNPLECLEDALNVIEKRTGKMINGKFVKDN
jgi:hypothetical protein